MGYGEHTETEVSSAREGYTSFSDFAIKLPQSAPHRFLRVVTRTGVAKDRSSMRSEGVELSILFVYCSRYGLHFWLLAPRYVEGSALLPEHRIEGYPWSLSRGI